jgi:hypothetical protein
MSAKEYGAPGEWAKLKGTIVSIWPIFLCSAMVGAFLTAMIMSKYMIKPTASPIHSIGNTARSMRALIPKGRH